MQNSGYCLYRILQNLPEHFTQHPAGAGQTYFEHLCHSWHFAYEAQKAASMFFLHGLIPCCCEYSGSSCIEKLNSELQEKLKTIELRTMTREDEDNDSDESANGSDESANGSADDSSSN